MGRTWGPVPLVDQARAGTVLIVAGVLVVVTVVVVGLVRLRRGAPTGEEQASGEQASGEQASGADPAGPDTGLPAVAPVAGATDVDRGVPSGSSAP
jgi:putative copper resistance protein D